jgi:hypothetical protein
VANITISYRRADSDAIAGRIRDRLALQYGDDVLFSQSGHERRDVWLRYARWLVAGLTNAIGRLAAVALIGTFLNYFLERDLAEVRERQGVP